MSKAVDVKYLHSEISSKIIQAFYTVYNHFRYGFPKGVYLNAMIIELDRLGLTCECQRVVKIYYEQIQGHFRFQLN